MINGKFEVMAPQETLTQSHCTIYTNVPMLTSEKILYVCSVGQLEVLWEPYPLSF